MRFTRREFLKTTTATAVGALATQAGFAEDAKRDLHFIVIGDTHYFADKDNPAALNEVSRLTTTGLINTLNSLPGTAIPNEAGGGKVGDLAAVVHAGDIIDSGDKNGAIYDKMHPTEYAGFTADFGLTGKDGKLKYPTYEIHGNHDGPAGKGVSITGIINRNKTRPGVKNVSENGVHYSWDMQGVHFVNLGITVGNVKTIKRKRRYNSLESLDFLIEDLKKNVGESKRPIVITHHIDIVRNIGGCDPQADPGSKEWDACDLEAFYNAIKPYNTIGIFYGHTHVRNMFKWNGESAKAAEGIDVYNVAKASHFSSEAQALFYVNITDSQMTVREYTTKNRWKEAAWTPQAWSKKLV